jgi:hypothetical protein
MRYMTVRVLSLFFSYRVTEGIRDAFHIMTRVLQSRLALYGSKGFFKRLSPMVTQTESEGPLIHMPIPAYPRRKQTSSTQTPNEDMNPDG